MHFNTHTSINATSKRYSARALFVLLAFAAMLVLAACGGSTGNSGGTTPTPTQAANTPTTAPAGNTPTATPSGSKMAVSITTSGTFAFSPATITIKVGTTVTWTNNTGAPHTVTSDDGTTFDSGINTPIAANGGTFSFTFAKAGTFTYHCQIHPFMKATVIVQA
jgi:amicyanin